MLIEGKDNIKASTSRRLEAFSPTRSRSPKCTPGVESFEILEPGKKFKALGALGLGTVKVKFDTTIEWIELTRARTRRK